MTDYKARLDEIEAMHPEDFKVHGNDTIAVDLLSIARELLEGRDHWYGKYQDLEATAQSTLNALHMLEDCLND